MMLLWFVWVSSSLLSVTQPPSTAAAGWGCVCSILSLSLPLTAAPAPVAADADAEWRDRKKVAPGLLWGVASHEAVEENKPTKKKFYDAITFINILLNNNTVHLFEWVCSFLNWFTFSNNEIAIIKKNLQILS